MNLAETIAQERRGIILRALADQDTFALSDTSLQVIFDRRRDPVGLDLIHDYLAWLARHGLVSTTSEHVGREMVLATLTARGEDVARGRERVPGVKRPLAQE